MDRELPAWLDEAMATADGDAVLVTPHWGPNMTTEPLPRIRAVADAMLRAGATLVAGHSAHVFHGVAKPVLRNDLGLLFIVTLDEHGPRRLEALPLKLDFGHTRLEEISRRAGISRPEHPAGNPAGWSRVRPDAPWGSGKDDRGDFR